jgi:predicted aspartyl protease
MRISTRDGQRLIVLTLGLASLCGNGEARQQKAVEPSSATVPLLVELNRPFVDLQFSRPDGSQRTARFWVDTGGGGFLFVEPLARDLGLKFGDEVKAEGERMSPTTAPPTRIGGMQLNVEGTRAIILLGKRTMNPGVEAEGLLPAHLLRRYHVVFDYPGKKFTIARPGSLKPRGVRITAPVHERSGFPRIEVEIAGKPFGFLLDTGASYTMISVAQLEAWSREHPGWPKAVGAVGAANMGLGAMEANGLMLGMPEIGWGDFRIKSVAAISRPVGTFERYMSAMMTSPIVGALGGNILRAFRVEIDYANGVVYLEKKGSPDTATDIVGLTLTAAPDGTYTVAGVAKQNGIQVIETVRPGDKLLKIDGLVVNGANFSRVVDALRGKQGQKRALVLERDGKQIDVVASVTRIL